MRGGYERHDGSRGEKMKLWFRDTKKKEKVAAEGEKKDRQGWETRTKNSSKLGDKRKGWTRRRGHRRK